MLLPDSEILHDRSYRKIGEYCVNLKDVILKFCDMKFRLALLMMILFPALACVAKPSRLSELTVMSYNIRVGDADDGTNSWRFRFPATALMIEDQKPDVFGVQEAMSYQLLFISENCLDYKYVGVGRDDGRNKGEHVAIFYNKKTVSLLKWGTFWLSETPDKPSLGWDAAFRRSTTWAIMKSKESGKKFMFVATHFDNEGQVARKESSELILSEIAELNKDNLPVVLVGDFNSGISDPAVAIICQSMKNARKIAADTDSHATYNGWGKASDVIDHIFYSGFRSCMEFQTVTKPYDGLKFISDHYPVKAVLMF